MTVEQTYLALLRSALWGTDLPVIENLPEILQLTDRQKTRGLIYDILLRSGADIPTESARKMQRMLARITGAHRVLDDVVARSVAALQEAKIPCVLLKGQGAARYYPDPRLRECGDIDLHIGPERLEEAVRALTPLADRVDDHLLGKHWQLWIGGAEIELHQHTMLHETRRQTRVYQRLEENGLRTDLVPFDFSGVAVPTPEDSFNAFYLFYHAWHHFAAGGIGFRQLCDWILLLHTRAARIDRERLHTMLREMRLLGPWRLFGCIAVHDLGLPEAEFPFYDKKAFSKSRRVLQLILSEGNFGRGTQFRFSRPKGYLAGKLYSLGLHFRRLFQMLRIAPGEAFRTFHALFVGGIRQVFLDLSHR